MSKKPKKVVWIDDYDGSKFPACPKCYEPAYYEDECCFCGQVFEQDEAVKEFNRTTQVEKDGYIVVQAPNNHIHVYDPDGKMISHASCTEKMTEKGLLKHLDFVLNGFWRAVK